MDSTHHPETLRQSICKHSHWGAAADVGIQSVQNSRKASQVGIRTFNSCAHLEVQPILLTNSKIYRLGYKFSEDFFKKRAVNSCSCSCPHPRTLMTLLLKGPITTTGF